MDIKMTITTLLHSFALIKQYMNANDHSCIWYNVEIILSRGKIVRLCFKCEFKVLQDNEMDNWGTR